MTICVARRPFSQFAVDRLPDCPTREDCSSHDAAHGLDGIIAAVQTEAVASLDLSATCFSEVVAKIHRFGLSGTLTSFHQLGERSLLFIDGELRAARSTREGEGLGSWLVEEGLISNLELQNLIDLNGSDNDGVLASSLLRSGAVGSASLERHLKQRAWQIAKSAACDNEKEMSFCDGHAKIPPMDVFPNDRTAQLTLELARIGAIEVCESSLEPRCRLVVLSQSLGELRTVYELDPREAFLLSRLDGRRSIDDFTDHCGVLKWEAELALWALHTAGLVRFEVAVGRSAETGAQDDLGDLSDGEHEERRQIIELARKAHIMDHYKALEVHETASNEQIWEAWHRCRTRFNPGRSAERHLRDQEHSLHVLLERSESAFAVLGSTFLRHRYDLVRAGVLAHLGSKADEQEERVLEARREHAAANVQRAKQLMSIGEHHLAIVLLEAAARLEPSAEIHVLLARILSSRSTTTDRALRALKSAIRMEPEHSEAWLELAAIWRRRGNPERERKALNRALVADPSSAKVQKACRRAFGAADVDGGGGKSICERLAAAATRGRTMCA